LAQLKFNMSPLYQYHNRYIQLRDELSGIKLQELIEVEPSKLNNLFMAGMGMGTLFLRMGAVIQMSEKLHDGDTNNDALFMKQVVDNLRETLPSDTNWKNLWNASMQIDSKWSKAIPRDSNKNTILDRFVTFRNKYVHQYIRLVPEQLNEIEKGLQLLDDMSALYQLFDGGEIILEDEQYFWKQKKQKLELHPFVQKGKYEGLPYLFQGLHANKSKAKFINTLYGDETEPQINLPLDKKFQPMQMALRGGAGQVFDHSDRLKYYLDCFVGREREVQSVMDWVNSETENNVMPIYSEAGMGKGALTAGVIDKLLSSQIPVMYHYCGSGMANSLHAVLYHFILQGKQMPGMNGAGVWKIEDETIQRKMERLPSRYFDAIKLFQNLLTDCYATSKKYEGKPLVIVIDGLDEAAVANSQLKIADWFYTYNDKDEIEDDWIAPSNVKWIFTYRLMSDKSNCGFQLGSNFNLETNELLQPLNGLTEEAVREALGEFEVSEEFIQAVLDRGVV
jgi:hypothetical protein